MNNLSLAFEFQGELITENARLRRLNKALLAFYESLKMPPEFHCYNLYCDTCKAERAVRRELRR